MLVYAYSLYHPGLEPQRWHVFISYLIICWTCCFIVMYANRALPMITKLGTYFIVAGFFIIVIVCAVMPSITGSGYQSDHFVWTDWTNKTGYTSTGFVFLSGMINGAFAIGATDTITHVAEEIPRYTDYPNKAISLLTCWPELSETSPKVWPVRWQWASARDSAI